MQSLNAYVMFEGFEAVCLPVPVFDYFWYVDTCIHRVETYVEYTEKGPNGSEGYSTVPLVSKDSMAVKCVTGIPENP